MEVHVFMPRETPEQHKQEVRYYGARLTEVDGNIGDCGKLVAGLTAGGEWFNVSTLKEPYRLEGKKTMGYELAEQMNWELPDVILYPTGGGTGLIGFWKAFEELGAERVDRIELPPGGGAVGQLRQYCHRSSTGSA
jgi:threonine synthase